MLPLGFEGRGKVAVAAGLGVAATVGGRVRVGVALGADGVGEAGSGVKVGGMVGVGGGLVAVGGGGGSVMVGVGTRVGVGGALHPTAMITSAVSASRMELFSFTIFSFQQNVSDKFNRRDTASADKCLIIGDARNPAVEYYDSRRHCPRLP